MRFRWLVAFALVALSSCGRDPRRETIRIGVNPWPGYEYFAVAAQQGMFEAEGLEVEIVEYSSLTDVLLAYEQTRVDALTCSAVEALIALDQSHRRPVATVVTDCSFGADMIFANRETVSSIEQLKGRRIGIEVRSLSTFILARALDQCGLKIEDVTIVPSDQLSIERQLAAGEIDAAVSYPPTSERLRDDPRYVEVFSTRAIPDSVFDALFVDATLIEGDPELPAKLQRVWARVLAWAERDRELADAIMARRESLSVEDFRNALGGMTIFPPERQRELLAPNGPFDRSLREADRLFEQLNQYESPVRLDVDPRAYLATPSVE